MIKKDTNALQNRLLALKPEDLYTLFRQLAKENKLIREVLIAAATVSQFEEMTDMIEYIMTKKRSGIN